MIEHNEVDGVDWNPPPPETTMICETSTEPLTRVITLTSAPPVRIRVDEWPVIASASWAAGGMGYGRLTGMPRRHQAREGWFFVRAHHEDGRAIVYGGLDGNTADAPRGRGERAGYILDGTEAAELVAAIVRVAHELRAPDTAVQELIAKLPPVEI